MGFSITDGVFKTGRKIGFDWKLPTFDSDVLRTDKNFKFFPREYRYLPSIDSENAFKLPGLSIEPQGVKPEEKTEESPDEGENEDNTLNTENGAKTQSVKVGNNNGRVIIIVGDNNTINIDDLPEPQEGEVGNASGWVEFLKQKEQTMVCRDDSGRTQNISGKFETKSFNTNPDEFTITDNSSGEDHVYKFKKVAVDDKGRPIYTCVSMNGEELDSNQYTLVWKEDGTPELVQYSDQDNYGIGLRKKPVAMAVNA